MERVAQGGTVTLTAEYLNGAGNLVDPVTPAVDVIDAADVQLVADATPTRLSLGNYSYAYVVPADGEVGIWRIHWTGTVDGAAAGGDDWFSVVTPGAIITSAFDLLTLDEAKRALNIGLADTSQDVELAAYISAVSVRIDGMCGPVIIRTVTEVHDGGAVAVRLRKIPVASVTAITEAGTAVAVEDYAVDGELGMIYRRTGTIDGYFAYGRNNVTVVYQAGRFTSTAAVDARFKLAATIFLSHLWRYEQGEGTTTFGAPAEGLGVPTFGTPNAVRDLLADELLGPGVG